MRILNESNVEVTNPDLSKGYLKPDKVFVKHHEATLYSPEKGHYEVTKEYPNGGRDIEWMIDQAEVLAHDAYDEYEEIQRYVLYTNKELSQFKINELKQKLSETDYIAAKIAEGVATKEEYKEQLEKRQEWRNQINSIQEQYGG